MCGTGCCCTSEKGHHRRYLTKAEQTERLQQYAKALENELQAVKERLENTK